MPPSNSMLYIAPEAIPRIEDVTFNQDKYCEHLLARGAQDSAVERLQIRVAPTGFTHAAATFGAPPEADEKYWYAITLSPTAMPSSSKGQAKVLTHETEHFLYYLTHPNSERNEVLSILGISTLAAIRSARKAYSYGGYLRNFFKNTPETRLKIGAAIGGGAASFAIAASALELAYTVTTPNEIRAYASELQKNKCLPEDILKIHFKKPAIISSRERVHID